ncbi:hypothetical protein IQ215_10350 [Cyanobacterium stanieri LEGE 03274]|uniref:Uncharacterized protein n=1 Tax=Cyanobacterium stanieri LEGE 03274 TaxID=1828756 RepID=A0ABR9V6G4_9CHRO|nr:hypothetical protein [Cyanobacterium stanieri]MBE9223096.1 hypothetical protein [Cyanobacterium stanieri LEGE 03274]
MFSLRIRFRAIASRIQVLDLTAKDLTVKKLLTIAQEHLPRRLEKAISQRQDLEDLETLWEILGIDAVIALENEEGKLIRVGVTLLENEGKAQNIFYDMKGKQRTAVREKLNLEQFWIMVLKSKNFPEEDEWIDILYREIDQPPTASGCRLIIL